MTRRSLFYPMTPRLYPAQIRALRGCYEKVTGRRQHKVHTAVQIFAAKGLGWPQAKPWVR